VRLSSKSAPVVTYRAMTVLIDLACSRRIPLFAWIGVATSFFPPKFHTSRQMPNPFFFFPRFLRCRLRFLLAIRQHIAQSQAKERQSFAAKTNTSTSTSTLRRLHDRCWCHRPSPMETFHFHGALSTPNRISSRATPIRVRPLELESGLSRQLPLMRRVVVIQRSERVRKRYGFALVITLIVHVA